MLAIWFRRNILWVCFIVAWQSIIAARKMSNEENGMKLAADVFYYVCWYENLKVLPNTNTKQFGRCSAILQEYLHRAGNDLASFKTSLLQYVLHTDLLPKEYSTSCERFVQNYNLHEDSYRDNEGSTINGWHYYSFSGYAYCLLTQLRRRHGDKASEAVKNEKVLGSRDFRKALLNRENEFRAGHGVKPFTEKPELSEGAQKWADHLAAECTMYHSDSNSRELHGEHLGENIASGGTESGRLLEKDDAAFIAANEWYNEIANYPFPKSYHVGQELKGEIGHFTQLVWKDTEHAGYGYAYSSKCKQWFVVARYHPTGNIEGDRYFKENVLPPKWEIKPVPEYKGLVCAVCDNNTLRQGQCDHKHAPSLKDCGTDAHCVHAFVTEKDTTHNCEYRYCETGRLNRTICQKTYFRDPVNTHGCLQEISCTCHTEDCNGQWGEDLYEEYGDDSLTNYKCDPNYKPATPDPIKTFWKLWG